MAAGNFYSNYPYISTYRNEIYLTISFCPRGKVENCFAVQFNEQILKAYLELAIDGDK